MKNYNRIIGILQEIIDQGHIAGAYIKIRDHGTLVLDTGVGVYDPEGKDHIPAMVSGNTVFRLASMTKPVTVIAAMMLVEQGKIALTDSVARYLPSYDRGVKKMITIRSLLDHSCGIGMLGFPGMVQSLDLTEKNDKLKDRVERWSALVPDFRAGTDTGYSPNVGFDILGRIVEIVSGLDYNQYLKENIFEPLGMKDTVFIRNKDQKKRSCASFHDVSVVLNVPLPKHYGEKIGWSDAEIAGYYSGASGLWGTADDYENIAQLFLNRGEYKGVRLLEPGTVDLIRTPSNDMQPKLDVYWGLGMQIFGDPLKSGIYVNPGSYGWTGAYGTHFFVDPEEERTVVLMFTPMDMEGQSRIYPEPLKKLLDEYHLPGGLVKIC